MALTTRFLSAGFTPKRLLLWLVPFSIVGPAAILIGLAISKAASPEVELVLNGLGAGVILYMGVTEVICEEFGSAESEIAESFMSIRVRKFLAVVAGVLVILPATFMPHPHDH